jgi:uncharacterized protein YjaG (DUF416 family)
MSNQTIETNVVRPEISFFENDTDNLILTPFYESELENKINQIESYINDNSGKGKTDEEQDEIYKNSQNFWKEYSVSLRDTKYNFHLNRNQWKFLTDLILTKLDYDVNTVFFAIELTDLLGTMRDTKYTNDTELISFPVNATEITYIYHLIAQHKVKGLTKDAYMFSQVLKRIGSISKVFNYYDTYGKNLSVDIQNWVTSFEEGVSVEPRKKKTSKKEVEETN